MDKAPQPVAGATASGDAPRVSIVVVTYNAPEYVRKCVEDIRARSRVPYELILVDNASDAPTRDYVSGLQDARLILNDDNRLWCGGCNQGMRSIDPHSEYVLLLNSDIEILRDDWLEIQIAAMESAPKIGIVGPKHLRVPYGPMWGFVDGFCMMIRASLLQEVGYFDEERWPWWGAPAEFAVAAYAKGWRYRITHPQDEFIFHHEDKSQTPEFKESLKKLPRVRREFPGILARHGLQPEPSLSERWKLPPFIEKWEERRRFYHAPPYRAQSEGVKRP